MKAVDYIKLRSNYILLLTLSGQSYNIMLIATVSAIDSTASYVLDVEIV